MIKNDDFLETLLNSLKYAFSNMSALLVGGIVFFLSLLLIGLPFFLGYITRCMKEIVKGNGVMPEWDEIGQMFVDGIRMTGVFLVYLIVFAAIMLVPIVPLVVFGLLNVAILTIFSTAVVALVGTVVACALGILFFASWIIYANTGSVRKAITARKLIEFVASDPHRYLETLIASAAVALGGVVAMSLFVTIPWALFVICSAMTFVYAKFYQDTMKSTPHAQDWR